MNIKDYASATGLSAERGELFAYLLEEEGIELSQAQAISPRENADELPFSFAQRRLWFLDQLESGSPVYNIPAAFRLRGPLNVAALEQSFNEIVRRHEALRTTFAIIDGRPVQVIAPNLNLALPVVDLRHLSETEREAEAQRRATEEVQRPFDLAQGPLLRTTLVRLGDEEHVLLLIMHHIVSDGWSMGIFNRELALLYTTFSAGKPSPLPELPIQYADFAHWQRQWLQGEVLEAQLAYWKQQLGGILPVLELPTDRPRPAVQTFRGAIQSFALPATLTKSLEALSRQEGVTLFMTLLAAFETLLYRYTGQEDVLVGSPIANRNRAEIEGLIGFFVNTLVLCTDLAGNPGFQELLGRVREVTVGAYAHQDLPFEKLVEELQPERDLSRNPLFQVMFVFQNAPAEALALPGLIVRPLEVESRTARLDLTLSMGETEQGLRGIVEYSTDLFEAATITRMVGHFQTLLEGIVAHPEQRLLELPLLTDAERHQLLVEWNDTKVEYPQDKCIHHLFEIQVERTPNAVAVVFEEQQLTYDELNRQANQLAHYLQKLEVGSEVLVGLCVECSLEMVVGLLGILKAGGVYVPLDPAYPKERLAFMLRDTQAAVLLTQQRLTERLPEHEARMVCLDADWEVIARESEENLDCAVTAGDLAYVIYTSGSTGRPKGVAIAHQSTTALLHWAEQSFCAEDLAGVLASTSICFDLSVFELFVPLSWGSKVILAENALRLPSLPAAEDVTLVNTVPSAITGLLRMNDGLPASVRTVNLAGEPLRTQLVEQVYKQDTIQRVFDLYGPSEDTTYSTFALRSASGPDTIGRPIANTQVYLLDASLRPVPIGVPGELYIGGAGLARGYLNRPELTAEKFLSNPFGGEPGTRLYRTGDLARYLSDGNIEFLGRIDHQVKIRGFRIEPGEIEAVLGQYPTVQETVVLAREDIPGNRRLVAYVVALDQGQPPTVSELRRFLKEKLPEYMVPSAFVMLDALPLTPSGKVDRRTLPAPDADRLELEEAYVAPRTPVEEVLAGIWAEVLGLEQVGVYDNFFELGGDSLLSIQIVARANQAGIRLTPRQFFQYQIITELAALSGAPLAIQAEQGLVIGPVPLMPIQHMSIEFCEQNSLDLHKWNILVPLEARQALNPSFLERVVQRLLVHHDVLRMRFEREGSGWQQVIASSNRAVPFINMDLSALSESEQEAAIEVTAAELQGNMNLSEGPLLRVALFELGAHRSSRLLIVIHHLVSDWVSLMILLEDLQTAYQQLSRGEAIQLPPKTTSFKYWAERLAEHAQSAKVQQEVNYWLTESRKWVSRLPVDYLGGVNTVASARIVSASLSVEETQALLREVPKACGAQINDVLLTALVQVFARWAGERSLLVNLVGHGREEIFENVDLSRTAGHILSIFPVLLVLDEASNSGDALKTVKEQLRCIPGGGIGYGLLCYLGEDAEITEKLRSLPQSEVSFNYQSQFAQVLSESSLFRLSQKPVRSRYGERETRSRLLSVGAYIMEGRLQLSWKYSENIHRRSTIENLAQGFLERLRSFITHCRSFAEAG